MSVAMEDWPYRHRITVDEYHRMAEGGSFAPDARVELIDGVIIDMPPIGSPHAGTVDQLDALLHRAASDRAIIRRQSPIHLGDYSEPQPDLALLASRKSFYKDGHPTANDTLLVVEVSDTTLDDDLQRKMALYACHGIQDTGSWISRIADCMCSEVQQALPTSKRRSSMRPARWKSLPCRVPSWISRHCSAPTDVFFEDVKQAGSRR